MCHTHSVIFKTTGSLHGGLKHIQTCSENFARIKLMKMDKFHFAGQKGESLRSLTIWFPEKWREVIGLTHFNESSGNFSVAHSIDKT